MNLIPIFQYILIPLWINKSGTLLLVYIAVNNNLPTLLFFSVEVPVTILSFKSDLYCFIVLYVIVLHVII